MSEVLVRPRRNDDMAALIEILAAQQEETRYPMRWPFPGGAERFVRRADELEAWVAELDGAVVGHVAVLSMTEDDNLARIGSRVHGVPVALLRCVGVLFADLRVGRRGVGAALLAHASARALADGGAPVLDVMASHTAARSLYRSRGWRDAGRLRQDWLPDSEEPLYAMMLPRTETAHE